MKRKIDKTKKKKGTKKPVGISDTTPQNEKILQSITAGKAKSHRGRKVLESREPHVHEPAKHMIRKPFSVSLSRKQEGLDPFRDYEVLEYLTNKNQSGLFCYGSSSKTRPFRIVMGRMFEESLLDMYEVHISNYRPLQLFAKVCQPVLGSKPLVIAQGSEFESSESLKSFRNYLLDFFSMGKPNKMLLKGVDQLITITAVPTLPPEPGTPVPTTAAENCTGPRIIFRRYRVDQQKASGKLTPDVVLEECGPRFTMMLDRHQLPAKDIWKMAIKLPKEVKAVKVKNVTTNILGEKMGRIHVGTQDFAKLVTHHHHQVRGGYTQSTSTNEDGDVAI